MFKPGMRVQLKSLESFIQESNLYVGCKGVIERCYVNGEDGYNARYRRGEVVALFIPDNRYRPLTFSINSLMPLDKVLNRR